MLYSPKPGRHPRSFFEVVGRHFEQLKVPFLIPDLNRDLPFGVYVTMAHARDHLHPEVRAWYHTVCRWFDQFAQLMVPWQHQPNAFTERRLKTHAGIREPWEVRLGYTADGSRGRAVGEKALHRSLLAFFAARPDILRDCAENPDALSLATNFGTDRVSDVMVAVGKPHVIEFTKWCAEYFQFDPACMQEVLIKNVWQEEHGRFGAEMHRVPVDDFGEPILLVPRDIVRSGPPFSAAAYFREVYGSDYDGPTGKQAVLDDTAKHPQRLTKFARDYLKDPSRYKIRRDLRPPTERKRRK